MRSKNNEKNVVITPFMEHEWVGLNAEVNEENFGKK